jgi:NodT family efflux transporter outer membrane factor (OMF) lipoprotein
VKRPILLVLPLALLFGCAHPPPYTPPTAPSAPAFKEDGQWKTAAPSDEIVRGDWWTLFGDPQLTRLEGAIDVSNQNLKSAEARFEQARAALRITRASLYPQVTASPSVAVEQPSGSRAISPYHSVYSDILIPGDVSYEVDAWGRIRGAVNANVALAQASAADLETARLSLHAELAVDYFALQGLDREKQLLNQAVASYEQALQLTNNRFTGGIASQADVALAETQLETTRALTVDEDVQRAALEHAIATLVGEPASTFALERSPITATPPGVPPEIPSTLLERRPDIAGAERRVAAASAQVGVTRAAWYPIISLSGAAGVESSSFGKLLTATSTLWSVGPAALVTVFDAGRRHAVTAQAQASYNEAVADYRQTVLAAFEDVEDQLATLSILANEAVIQDRATAAAERSLAQATNRYRGGLASYLEVTTAQTAALTSERATVEIEMRRVSASVLLLKSTGGGWSALTPLPAPLAGSK